MKTEIKITARAYPVQIRDERTGEKQSDTIVLDKARLQAAAMVGMSDRDLIYRLYNRQGFRVEEIGEPAKADLTVDLLEVYQKMLNDGLHDGLPEIMTLNEMEKELEAERRGEYS